MVAVADVVEVSTTVVVVAAAVGLVVEGGMTTTAMMNLVVVVLAPQNTLAVDEAVVEVVGVVSNRLPNSHDY